MPLAAHAESRQRYVRWHRMVVDRALEVTEQADQNDKWYWYAQ